MEKQTVTMERMRALRSVMGPCPVAFLYQALHHCCLCYEYNIYHIYIYVHKTPTTYIHIFNDKPTQNVYIHFNCFE